MPRVSELIAETNNVVRQLVGCGLADDQNVVFSGSGNTTVTFPKAELLSQALKDKPYNEVYDLFLQERAYVARMPDGGIIQVSYQLFRSQIIRHRLAFLPSPYLIEYQNDPELYEEDRLFAEVLDKGVVGVPIRFDFDSRREVCKPIDHPKSHLSLGQYTNCRIPVNSAVSPKHFFEFIVRNFYNSAYRDFELSFGGHFLAFEDTLFPEELSTTHIRLSRPSGRGEAQ